MTIFAIKTAAGAVFPVSSDFYQKSASKIEQKIPFYFVSKLSINKSFLFSRKKSYFAKLYFYSVKLFGCLQEGIGYLKSFLKESAVIEERLSCFKEN